MNDIDKDNHIADFVDGKTASSPDPHLVQLEETILRLKQGLPNKTLDSATSKQMLVRLKARMKREEETASVPFWKKLFDFQSNPQVGLLLTITAVLIFAIVTIPSLQTGGGETITGTANNSNPTLIIGGLILILLGIYLYSRRK
jgi:LPXTG-motif cell wall-anchored protein